MAKYRNKKVTINGITYASIKEARRHQYLMLLEKAGEISNLRFQVPYEVLSNQYEVVERVSKNGKPLKPQKKLIERKVDYIADFVYTDKTGKEIVEDSKGVRTKDYVIKRKLMLYMYGIKISEV
jgi:hypothetical protein